MIRNDQDSKYTIIKTSLNYERQYLIFEKTCIGGFGGLLAVGKHRSFPSQIYHFQHRVCVRTYATKFERK